jgi:FtsZ-interacting cell division protein ZipA
MSDLQIALLIIGLVVIAAVYGYSKWQQREYSRRLGNAPAQRRASNPTADLFKPLSEKLAQSKFANQLESWLDHPLIKQSNEPAPASPSLPVVEAEIIAPVLVADTCILFNEPGDFVVELKLTTPCTASALAALWPHKFDFGKPVQVCGLTQDAPHWERVIADSTVLYRHLRIALQLVDRSGVMSMIKMASFADLIQSIAQNLPAECLIPDLNTSHQQAQELDKFCLSVDKMVGINLVPLNDNILFGTQIAQAATTQNLSLEADGAFHLLNIQGHSLFSLINQQNELFQHHSLHNLKTSGVTLLLDVPRANDPLGQFDLMLNIALQLADELNLNLVDDYLVTLDDGGLSAIRTQIAEVEARMFENGLTPGSVHARRLFA